MGGFMLVMMGPVALRPLGAQEFTIPVSGGVLAGQLSLPGEAGPKHPLVIFISGSGPTDRNGNQGGQGSNAIGMLADSLALSGIPSFRFDKRGTGASVVPTIDESLLRLDTFVSDLLAWITYWEADPRFDGIVLAGHSEGALIATLAARNHPAVKGLVTLAGAGRPADSLMLEQFSRQPAFVAQAADSLFRQLKAGLPVDPPPFLAGLFRESILPYLLSWIRIDPGHELARLDIPVLIIQGEADLQVGMTDARRLEKAARHGHMVTFPAMNHVLKDVESLPDNYKSYLDAQRPLTPGLVPAFRDWYQTRVLP